MNGPVDAPTLAVLDHFPTDLLNLDATELNARLGGPTLIRINPDAEAHWGAVFVSALIHGNETSGWDAIRRLFADRGMPEHRPVVLFLGNLRAAEAGVRTLPDQSDFNRIWTNRDEPLVEAVLDEIANDQFTASVDLHNNTGKNPPFAVVTDTEPGTLDLAAQFDRRMVLVESPASVLTRVFTDCPAIAVELGPVGDPACVDRAEALLDELLFDPPTGPKTVHPNTIYRAIARIFVVPGTHFTIGHIGDPIEADVQFTGHVEERNFHELDADFVLAHTTRPIHEVVRVEATDGEDVTDRFLVQEGDAIKLRERVIPAMSTTDISGVELDCFCYLMETIDVD